MKFEFYKDWSNYDEENISKQLFVFIETFLAHKTTIVGAGRGHALL